MGTNIFQEEIAFHPKDQYHTLRHFTYINEEYKKMLANMLGIDKLIFNSELNKVGSKFNTKYFQSPLEVFHLINNSIPHKTVKQANGTIVNSYLFEESIFQGGIGTDSIIEIDKLEIQQLSLIKKELRSGFLIKLLEIENLPITYELQVVLKSIKEQLNIITLFPGKYAPPFPNTKHNENSSKLFWESNCFLKFKMN